MSHEGSAFREAAKQVAGNIFTLELKVRALTEIVSDLETPHLHEVNAQLMLAVRKLEEAQDRMSRALVHSKSV